MEFREFTPGLDYTRYRGVGPVFDCDMHLYETGESFTRHLPRQSASLLRIAEVNGRTKLIIRGRISEFIPNPTFEVVAAPGSGHSFLQRKERGWQGLSGNRDAHEVDSRFLRL